MSVTVTVQRPDKRSEGRVLIEFSEGVYGAYTADEARELARGITSAAIELEHAERAQTRAVKHRAALKELRRPASVDEALREREGGV